MEEGLARLSQWLAQAGPEALALAAGLVVLLLAGLWLSARAAARRGARETEPLAREMGELASHIRSLADGQHQLAGGLRHVAESQSLAQTQVMQLLERRLEEVTRHMGESLHGSATRTARSLGELQTRLETIDRAQANIEKLSGNVLSLQDILSNKQTRGAFGEIQLRDIVARALPPDAYVFQATLSNGRRADCLIRMPHPPGPIVIDSKFPLEAYEALRAADNPRALAEAQRALRTALRVHIRAIAERYIIEGETAEGALLFLPSEAVYAELHAHFADVVREGFAARVWIVSPTTCMATLNTLRAVLKDARMREQAGAIRRELALLSGDVERLLALVDNLGRHFGQAARDVEEIRVSADKAGRRARRLDGFDFDGVEDDKQDIAPTPPLPPARAGE
ncbi:MAG: DNA recombination protein RmuC [Rhodobacteraceae bacterium]|nr:DNA recombination protein RmuC [Paracoccaceae bacterium]